MSEWAVTLQSGEETEVMARASRITSTGDLLFLNQDNEIVHAFAQGSWRQCKLTRPAAHGYGSRG